MNKKFGTISPTRIVHSLLAVALVLALTLVMFLIGTKLLGEGVIALVYLAPCAWCTVRWGKVAGTSAALTAALCFDYLFIPPYFTFNIGSLEGWLLFFLFLAASILVVGRFQTILSNEQDRGRKATLLYEVVVSIANQQTRKGIATAIADKVQQLYLPELVQVYLYNRGKLDAMMICPVGRQDCGAKSKPDRVLAIVSGPVLIGEIALWKGLMPLPAEDDPLMQSILRQTAAALDRVQNIEEKNLAAILPQQDDLNVSHNKL